MLYLLIFLLLIIYVFCLGLYKFDLFAAPCMMFLISIFCAICAVFMSGIYEVEVGINIIVIIILGCCSVLLGAIYAKKNVQIKIRKYEFKEISLSSLSFLFIHVFSLIYFFVIYINIQKIVKDNGYNYDNIASMISSYRHIYLWNEEMLPFFVRQFFRIFRTLTYVLLYIWLNNLFTGSKKIKHFYYFLPVFIFIFSALLQGQRSDMLYIFIAFFSIYIIFWQRKNGNLFVNGRILFRSMIFVILIGYLFSQIRFLVGRVQDWSALEYVSYYFGIPICAFQKYYEYKNEIITNTPTETFSALINNFARYLPTKLEINKIPFTYYNGKSLGNIYTAFKKFYYDFGYLGVCFFSFLESLYMSLKYLKLRYSNDINETEMIMYAYFIPAFYFMMYDEWFFSVRVCFGLAIDYFFVKLWTLLLIKQKIKFTMVKKNYA